MIAHVKKTRFGTVVSDKMDKTLVVLVERKIRHPKYIKTLKVSKKFKVHDESNTGVIGDMVAIEETRPLSKDKRWRLIKVMGKSAT